MHTSGHTVSKGPRVVQPLTRSLPGTPRCVCSCHCLRAGPGLWTMVQLFAACSPAASSPGSMANGSCMRSSGCIAGKGPGLCYPRLLPFHVLQGMHAPAAATEHWLLTAGGREIASPAVSSPGSVAGGRSLSWAQAAYRRQPQAATLGSEAGAPLIAGRGCMQTSGSTESEPALLQWGSGSL